MFTRLIRHSLFQANFLNHSRISLPSRFQISTDSVFRNRDRKDSKGKKPLQTGVKTDTMGETDEKGEVKSGELGVPKSTIAKAGDQFSIGGKEDVEELKAVKDGVKDMDTGEDLGGKKEPRRDSKKGPNIVFDKDKKKP